MSNDTALERISIARSNLLQDTKVSGGLFGSLSLALKVKERPDLTATMATDGTHLYFNAEWVMKQTPVIVKTTVAHEVGHNMLLHPYRVRSRDLPTANRAADYVVNWLLVKAGMTLWENALYDERFANMFFEQVYAILKQEEQDAESGSLFGVAQQSGQEQGNDAQQQPGGFLPAPNPESSQSAQGVGDSKGEQGAGAAGAKPMTELDWQVMTEEVTLAIRAAGNMSGDIEAYVKAARASTTDWRTVLHRWFEEVLPTDYSWRRVNRRMFTQGQYLPSVTRDSLPRIGDGIDTSMSVHQRLLDIFAEETSAIMRELEPEALEVVYCDSTVKKVEVFEPGDEIKFTPVGRGGTQFKPVFDHFEDDPPVGLLYFTDLLASDWPSVEEPPYPVLWVVPESHMGQTAVPFGEVLYISEYA